MKDNFKTEIMKKRSLKEEIEYRLGFFLRNVKEINNVPEKGLSL
ncbi:hypothetical protein BX788P2_00034 [Bacteroides phage BX788P2]|nr:hypothetical protein BX788P2_00034 [Bacteroides phage BX788P2]